MGPGEQFQGLDLRGISGDLAVMVPIHPHDLGENMGIAGIGLGSGGAVPLSVPSCRHRVDRIHPVPAGEQRRDPHPTIGLDPDHDRTVGGVIDPCAVRAGVEVLGYHLV
nr:hypothetical protein [Rhodococcus aetherivorans]